VVDDGSTDESIARLQSLAMDMPWLQIHRDRRRPWRESDGVVGALMPGNAGGAKGPDFWCAFEDGEVVVIGDEPENTIKDRRYPRLLCRGTKESYRRADSARRWFTPRVSLGEASRRAGCLNRARPVR
jgi:hypothetical protein